MFLRDSLLIKTKKSTNSPGVVPSMKSKPVLSDSPAGASTNLPTSLPDSYSLFCGPCRYFPKLSLDRARIEPISPKDLPKYHIPTRRPGKQTVSGIRKRLKSKNVNRTLADITAPVVSPNNSTKFIKENGAEFQVKKLVLSDGDCALDFTS